MNQSGVAQDAEPPPIQPVPSLPAPQRKKRLTDRQQVVFERLETMGSATGLDLWNAFGYRLKQSEIVRVLGALEKKGLVTSSGNPHLKLVGGVRYRLARPHASAELRELRDAVERAAVPLTWWSDEVEQAVTILVPLDDLAASLRFPTADAFDLIDPAGRTAIELLESLLLDLRRGGVGYELEIDQRLHEAGASMALAVLLRPVVPR